MPETDTNTAAVDYIDATTGALTDGEAWVNICSAKITNDSGLSDVTFQSSTGKNDWSQYQDLVLLGQVRATGSSGQLHYNFNDSTSGYSFQLLDQYATSGAGVSCRGYTEGTNGSRAEASVMLANSGDPTYTFSPFLSWFPDVNSGKMKLVYTHAGYAHHSNTGAVSQVNCKWSGKDAITKIKIWTSGTNLADHSRLELYGILPRMAT